MRSINHLQDSVYTVSGTSEQSSDKVRLLINCPLHELKCQSGVAVQGFRGRRVWRIEITVFGEPISQPQQWTYPQWGETWQGVEVQVICGDKQFNLKLPDFIRGIIRERKGLMGADFSNGILAPFVGKWQILCSQHKAQVRLGIESRKAHVFNDPVLELPKIKPALVELSL